MHTTWYTWVDWGYCPKTQVFLKTFWRPGMNPKIYIIYINQVPVCIYLKSGKIAEENSFFNATKIFPKKTAKPTLARANHSILDPVTTIFPNLINQL